MTPSSSSSLTPFVFGHGPWLEAWRARVPAMNDGHDAVAIDVLADDSVVFFKLMLAANARAFGDIGMPAWVQLDCATLPTAMVGFASRARDLDVALVDDLAARAGLSSVSPDQLVPLAEYTALCTPVAGDVVGISLFSLQPGLGLRAKALGLLVMGARSQTGITQIDNIALRTHARFGPLEIVKLGVQVHSRPSTTLVYRLQVPDDASLATLARGTSTRVPFGGTTRSCGREDLRVGDRVVDIASDDVVIAA